VLRRGPAVDSLPLYLQSRIYIDFTDDSQLERSLEDLLRVLHGSPAFTRPPLGTAPKFALKSAKAANRATTPLEPATVAQFKQLVEFAFGTAGLNMGTKADAAEWAQQWLENHAIDDLGPFVDVIEAITSRGAYAISDSQRTAKLAERFLSDHGADALVPFREYMDYAYSGDGLNLPTRVAAAEWALTQLDKHRSA
jgi:sulfite reductase alpha subunit-like flavoprotein